MDNENVVEYQLDSANRICEVNAEWDEFAEKNGAPELFGHKIIGQNIRKFVSGDVSQMFVQSLIDAVRVRGERLIRPYRCDSPDRKRFMEMTASPLPEENIRLSHRLIRVEPMQKELHFRLCHFVQGGRPQVFARCSMCNRLRTSGKWLEPDVALPAPPSEVPVIYGVCPDCMGGVRQLRRLRHPDNSMDRTGS